MGNLTFGKTAFKNVTNETFTIQGAWGYESVVIYPDASVDATIVGTGQFLGVDSDTVIIKAGSAPIPLESNNGLDGISVTAPAGCTIVLVFNSGNLG